MAEVESCALDVPTLDEISQGLCGKPRIADVGGVPYLVPTPKLNKIYNINTVAKQIDLPGAYILGAGASSHRSLGINAELILSVQAEGPTTPTVNGNYVASINPEDSSCLLEKYREKHSDNDFGLLSNLYASEGKAGKVIEVHVKKRTGDENFVSCMRKALKEYYGERAVGMGGTFIIQKGKAKLHIMPREFSACPLNTDDDVNRWLKYYTMRSPLICQSVFVSHDPGLDLRLEHTHCFSHHGEGGHYHNDTTPETVEYLGYFHPADILYRIDKPSATHMVGRD
ncbi:ester hydrolase C11orf54 homolog isoform X2 [Bombina bombina]|uniref:ester hydrolase C11orf54 homolog isoform X2 n=1 Tax=Bombina bombina TaxID=8345 RepID=UPI00235AE946|nr:ester hydrolase C11orf54 homolog isoform X2 [Bombina bombina]